MWTQCSHCVVCLHSHPIGHLSHFLSPYRRITQTVLWQGNSALRAGLYSPESRVNSCQCVIRSKSCCPLKVCARLWFLRLFILELSIWLADYVWYQWFLSFAVKIAQPFHLNPPFPIHTGSLIPSSSTHVHAAFYFPQQQPHSLDGTQPPPTCGCWMIFAFDIRILSNTWRFCFPFLSWFTGGGEEGCTGVPSCFLQCPEVNKKATARWAPLLPSLLPHPQLESSPFSSLYSLMGHFAKCGISRLAPVRKQITCFSATWACKSGLNVLCAHRLSLYQSLLRNRISSSAFCHQNPNKVKVRI